MKSMINFAVAILITVGMFRAAVACAHFRGTISTNQIKTLEGKMKFKVSII
jgi:hypothetical protein